MKKNKKMMVVFLAPALIMFSIVYLYPVARTILMSFFAVERPSAPMAEWTFNGFANYGKIFEATVFKRSMLNIFRIWCVGGVFVMVLSLLMAVILTSGVRFKSFFRAMIYMPNVVSAVALAAMWIYYAFDQRFGLFHNFFKALGMDNLARIKWLGGDTKFWAMLIAFCFAAVGYYMLIWISGIEKIPQDLFEAATIDGANKFRQFTNITLPLLKGTFKMNMTFWSINSVAFFVWTKMFSPVTTESSTVVPMTYMYDTVFGSKSVRQTDAGAGAAVGCVLALVVMIVFFVINRIVKDDDLEY